MNRASENGPQASLRAAGTHDGQEVSCVCGATRFICTGKPIIVTECHYDSCRKSGGHPRGTAGRTDGAGAIVRHKVCAASQGPDIPVSGTEHLRDLRGLTQAALAEKAGLNRVTVTEIETGRKQGSVATLRALAGALGVALEDLAV